MSNPVSEQRRQYEWVAQRELQAIQRKRDRQNRKFLAAIALMIAGLFVCGLYIPVAVTGLAFFLMLIAISVLADAWGIEIVRLPIQQMLSRITGGSREKFSTSLPGDDDRTEG